MSAARSMWHGATLGDRLGLIRTLEKSRPLAVRLVEGSTAGPAQYSEEPTSTWGYNPFHIPYSPSQETYSRSDRIADLAARIKDYYCQRIYMDCARRSVVEALLTTWVSTPKPIDESMRLAAIFGKLRAKSDCTARVQPPDRTIPSQPKEERLQAVEVDLDDYFDSSTLKWDENLYQAAKAARTFNEDPHADH